MAKVGKKMASILSEQHGLKANCCLVTKGRKKAKAKGTTSSTTGLLHQQYGNANPSRATALSTTSYDSYLAMSRLLVGVVADWVDQRTRVDPKEQNGQERLNGMNEHQNMYLYYPLETQGWLHERAGGLPATQAP